MSLLDNLVKMATDALGGLPGGEAMVQKAVSHLGGDNGLQGVLEQLQQGGLGDQVKSWVGSGSNLPISPEQIASVLGNTQVTELAEKFGVQPEAVSNFLADQLPGLADKLPKA